MAAREIAADLIDPQEIEAIRSLLDAYDEFDMETGRYVGLVVVPSILFFVVTVVGGLALPLPFMVRLPIPLLGLLGVVTALIYPKLILEGRAQEMENHYHLLITHMTVLSTTNIDRMEVFRRLANQPEYGALADEVARIVKLVDTWNQSLDDACRRRAHRVPSDPISDFFDRLAYSVNAGQDLGDFLLSEQEVVVRQYATIYEGALNNLEVMKDLYLSMILSMTFAMVFAVVLPVLTGTDPVLTVASVLVLYVFVQAGFAFAIRSIAPSDPTWYHAEEIETDVQRTITYSMVAAVVLVLVLSFLLFGGAFGFSPIGLATLVPGVDSIPLPLYPAIPVTPLLIPGLVVRTEEMRIKGRDDEFPSFIRALGASEGAKQSTTSAVLKNLRNKDFGPLTPAVNDLYRRLRMRIEPTAAWHHFAAESHSYLVQKFSEMYLTGRQMGGDPKQLGELISENMTEVLQLRQHRRQSTRTMVGLLYGITASATFAFFIGYQIVILLTQMSVDLGSNVSSFQVGQLIHTQSYNVMQVQFLLVLVFIFNALISSLLIRTIDRGHKMNAYFHFVAFMWLSGIVAVTTKALVGAFLNV